ncbi:hypothetical protein I546_3697 [Mycobacterium kansasii 732]|nr:hypothetical protein I546_3697 [Mycobacterium kansasii 732]
MTLRCGVGAAASVRRQTRTGDKTIRSSIRQFDYSGGSMPVSP